MLLLLLPLTACPSLGGETNCTTEARASVQLTVEDEAGSPIPDASLTWTEPDGVPTTCENMSAGEYVCGWEAAGELTIEVTATGFDTQQFGVTVGEDECHVITEMVTVTLVPSISPG
jgi:hypothetical protein